MNMMLQAVDHGIYINAVAGFSPEMARERFSIPEGCNPVTVLATGYS